MMLATRDYIIIISFRLSRSSHTLFFIFITFFYYVFTLQYTRRHAYSSEWKTNDKMLAMKRDGEEQRKSAICILLKAFSAFDSLIPNLLLKWIDAINLVRGDCRNIFDKIRVDKCSHIKIVAKELTKCKMINVVVSFGSPDAIWQS